MNKAAKKLTDDEAKKGKAKKNVWKVARVQRRKAYYSAQPMRTIANKKRAIARHLKRFPEDAQGAKYCTDAYSAPFAAQCVAGCTGKARARAKLRERAERRTRAKVAAVVATDEGEGFTVFHVEPPAYAPYAEGAA